MESLGATAIDRNATVTSYIDAYTGGAGFDIVYDTVGGPVLDSSFLSVKRYSGHVVSCLGWGTHALAPLSFRAATYSGVFTLLPLLSGNGRAHHGRILEQAARLADAKQLRPLLAEQNFGDDIDSAYSAVEKGNKGKVVLELF